MSEWSPKRFWTNAKVAKTPEGFVVKLDGRDIKTPGKAALVMPTRALADAVCAEWAEQGEKIDPRSMPVTRTVNSAIDKVAPQRAGVVEVVAAYGDADLLCYRATSPQELVHSQSVAWDPILDWAASALNVRLHPREGVMHRHQDQAALDRLAVLVGDLFDVELAAFHDLVSLSGSLIIGFAVVHGFASDDDLWAASRFDEAWQEQQWGEDEVAAELARQKQSTFLKAAEILRLATKK